MNFAKTTSLAALGALLALGAPALAQTGTTTQTPPSAGATTLNPDGSATGGSSPMGSPSGSTEGRNNTANPGDQKAAGSGNSDDGRRDCTSQQTPC